VGAGSQPVPFTSLCGSHGGGGNSGATYSVPERFQVSRSAFDCLSANVLGEDVRGLDFSDDAQHVRPSIDGDATPARGARERLAWVAAADNVDLSAPWASVERDDVVPDREERENLVSLPREQHTTAEGINLNSADGAPSKEMSCQDAPACPCKKCQVTHLPHLG
jgi:hypothetical protein